MKKIFSISFIFSVLISCQKENKPTSLNDGTVMIRGNKYKLDWSDEFDYTGLPDATKWKFETGFVRNNETQFYTDKRIENCNVNNGKLYITALNDSFENHSVTSASIETKGIKDFKYGLIEVRAKMPHIGSGSWPAIWMLGINHDIVGWPKCGEIDIMEWIGKFPTVVLGSLYVQANNSTTSTERHWPFLNINTDFFTEQFHNYAIEWDSTQLKYYVDDANYTTFTKQDLGANWESVMKAQYLKLDLAMGGSIPPLGGGGDIDYTKFPFTFEVEYARCYKKVE
ncbi:MAG TPA: glycoside hydrolase family 16 protein [Chitinophagales bacterium]|nr:glycoside hydrolase family 16 protein [Chitinophagales bacterium]